MVLGRYSFQQEPLVNDLQPLLLAWFGKTLQQVNLNGTTLLMLRGYRFVQDLTILLIIWLWLVVVAVVFQSEVAVVLAVYWHPQ
jgi:hypothetical protein